jgi:endonuclease YncB( thermonuclease family)
MLALLLCTVAYVNDGDTLRCTDGTRIRLAGIDAPELPGHCQQGRACAPGDPYRSKQALEAMVTGRTLRCLPNGTSYNRVTAWCSADGQDLSCAMLGGGYAIRYDRFWRGHRCR